MFREIKLNTARTLQLFALSHVHRLGIVHRDIKPENFLVSLTDPSKILLIDFGISQVFRTGVASQYNPLKESRHVVGTLHWASLNAHDGIGKSRLHNFFLSI